MELLRVHKFAKNDNVPAPAISLVPSSPYLFVIRYNLIAHAPIANNQRCLFEMELKKPKLFQIPVNLLF